MFNDEYAEKEKRRIENIKKRELERRNRLFNGKQRMFGVDKSTLDKQVEEKKRREEISKLRDLHYHEQMCKFSEMADESYKSLERRRLDKIKELNEFREKYQHKSQGKEWDLNDPDMLKKDKIGRLYDFHGEDINNKDRTKSQQQQLKKWIEDKISEDKKKKDKEDYEEWLRQEQDKKILSMANEIEKKQNDLRDMKTRQLKEFNIERANKKYNDEMKRKQNEQFERLNHVKNLRTSDHLTESYKSTVSNTRKGGYVHYNFKGFDENKYKEFEEIRKQQIEEKRKKDEHEREKENAFNIYEQNILHLAKMKEKEINDFKQEKQKKMYDVIKTQQKNQRMKKKVLDDMYKGEFTEEFFGQFNKHSR